MYDSNDHDKQLLVSESNFTSGCGNIQYGGLVIFAVNSSSITCHLNTVVVTQKILNGGDGIVLQSNQTSVSRYSIKTKISHLAGTHHTRGLSIKTSASWTAILLKQTVFTDNSGGGLCLEVHRGTVDQLAVEDSLFLHQRTSTRAQYGVYISATKSEINSKMLFKNLAMSLGNAFTEVFVFETADSSQPFGEVPVSIQSSLFESNVNAIAAIRLALDIIVSFPTIVLEKLVQSLV